MRIQDLIQSSLQSLQRTRARSILTMLGIVIGVMSVILMLSIGEAAQRYILQQISSFGSDTIFVMNGPSVDEGQPTLFIKESLTMRDAKKLQTVPWISAVSGQLMQTDRISANGVDTNVTIMGVMADELRFSQISVQYGNFFSSGDVDSGARVAVIGVKIAEAAFGAENPLGKLMKINGQGFRVVGVLQAVGSKGFTNIDTVAYVPVTAALDLYHKQYLSYLSLKTTLPINTAKENLTVLLRERHNIDNPSGDLTKDDFHVQTQEDLVRSASTITSILQILLMSIGAISLLVGGIGIMNIMYVAVTERIKEIGLRKAIGARPSDILRQFIFEALVLTTIGGIIGTTLGIGIAWLGVQILHSFDAGWSFELSWNGIVLGVSVSAAIGVLFGFLPARRAAKLSPIAALNAE